MLRILSVVATLLLGTLALARADVVTGPSSDVRIETLTGVGSGVYIGNGFVVTAAHVVLDEKSNAAAKVITIIVDRDGAEAEKLNATVAGAMKVGDYALLHMDRVPAGMQSAKLACRAPRIGEPIELVGNPLGMPFVHYWGHVAGVERVVPHSPWPVASPVDISLVSGVSGGPFYDQKGNVLGIAVGVIGPTNKSVGAINFMVPMDATVCGKLHDPDLVTNEEPIAGSTQAN